MLIVALKNGKTFFSNAVVFFSIFLVVFQLFSIIIVRSESNNVIESKDPDPVELVEKRTQTTKTFAVEDKSRPLGYRFITQSFASKIHYQSAGKWLEINNNIVASTSFDFDYENKANDFKVYFSKNVAGGLRYVGSGLDLKIEKIAVDGQDINTSQGVRVVENKIIYTEILPAVDLEFSIQPEGLEKKLILKSNSALQQKFEKIDFYLQSNLPLQTGENRLNFQNNSMVFLTKAITTDSGKALIEEKISLNNNVVTVTPNQQFLRSPERFFPVVIDPGIETKTPTEDTFVSSTATTPQNAKKPRVVGNYQETTVAGNPWYLKSRSFLKFAGPQSPVVSAKLKVYHYGTTSGPFTAGIYRINGDNFSEADTNWSNQPGLGQKYGELVFPQYNSNTNTAVRTSGDISDLVNTQLASGKVVLGIKSVDENQSKGSVFCQKNTSLAPCSSQNTAAILEYESNYPPAPPLSISPDNNTFFSGNCDQSVSPATGVCNSALNIEFKVGNIQDGQHLASDTANNAFAKIVTSNNNRDFEDLGGYEGGPGFHGEKVLTRIVPEGSRYWGTKLKDQYGLESDLSSTKLITVDTSPPSIPEFVLPEFSPGNQIQFTINKATDNLSAQDQIAYFIEVSPNPNFENKVFSGWQNANTLFQIPGLNGAQKYFYRIKSRDKLTNNSPDKANISAWSNTAFSTQDNVLPLISDLNLSKIRFSPVLGGNAELSFNFDEENFSRAVLEVKNAFTGQIVKTLQNCKFTSGVSSSAEFVDCGSENLNFAGQVLKQANLKFEWDGKNQQGTVVDDGAYNIKVKVVDKAGNWNDPASEGVEQIVIVDSSGANIGISIPKNGSYVNTDKIEISGSVASLNRDNLQDRDFTSLEIKNDHDKDYKNITEFVDDKNNFNISESLITGPNRFKFRTTDEAGNQVDIIGQNQDLVVNKDTQNPKILQIKPNALLTQGINNKNPILEFVLDDENLLNNQDIGAGFFTGVNPSGYQFSLLRDLKNDGNWQEIPIYSDGVNLTEGNPKLAGDLICNQLERRTKVSCSLQLSNLVPDGKYRILIKIRDLAGNYTCNQGLGDYSGLNLSLTCSTSKLPVADKTEDVQAEFIVDTNTLVTSNFPVQSAVYSSSMLEFNGQAEKGGILEIKNTELNKKILIKLDSQNQQLLPAEFVAGSEELIANQGQPSENRSFSTEPIFINCGKFIDIDKNPETVSVEMCDYSIKLKQKTSTDGINKNLPTINRNNLKITDEAGNTVEISKNISIDLYSLSLSSQPDIIYFSPNGDGRQDSVNFQNRIINSQNPEDIPQIKNYKLAIYNSANITVREISGQGSPVSLLNFDGKNEDGQWLEDGNYYAVFELVTTDEVIVKTGKIELFARTELVGSVVITSPKTEFVTSRGVINIQGQAQYAQGSFVKICIDDLSTLDKSCDSTEIAFIDQNSFFTTIASLPSVQGKISGHYFIQAVAVDMFGNVSAKSNEVKVILDTGDDIFKNVEVVSSFRGLNSQKEIDDFLVGKLSLDKIKSLQLRSVVHQNTQAVDLDFAEYVNIDELPETNNSGYSEIFHGDGHIATLNNQIETDKRLNPYADGRIKKDQSPTSAKNLPSDQKCTQSECSWFYNYPTPFWLTGGKYEIRFRGYKGETIQDVTKSVALDGRRASAPKILLVQKEKSGLMVAASDFQGKYYTNSRVLKLIGVADPKAMVQMSYTNKNSEVIKLPLVQAQNSGKFEISLELPDEDFQYQFESLAILGESVTQNLDKLPIVLDRSTPVLEWVQTAVPDKGVNPWVWSGDRVDFNIKTTKPISGVRVLGEDGFVATGSTPDNLNFSSSLNINRKLQGIYYPKIQLTDFAGNTGVYSNNKEDLDSIFISPGPASGVNSSYPYSSTNRGQSEDFRLFVDNTGPEMTDLQTADWGDNQNGVNADGILPEKDRLISNFVLRGKTLKLEGYVEEKQRAVVDVLLKNRQNQKLVIVPATDNCMEMNSLDQQVVDNLIVKSSRLCKWEYVFEFSGDGKTPFGVPQDWYVFQAAALDLAGNQSQYGKSVTVYQDKQSPQDSAITKISSASYSPLIDYPNKSITKDTDINIDFTGERQADVVFSYGKNGQKKLQKVVQNNLAGTQQTTLPLGLSFTDQSRGQNCITKTGNRLVGICDDGFYDIDMQIYDTAGNFSQTIQKQVERDTVAPAKATVKLEKSGDILSESLNLKINGESGAKVKVTVTTQKGFKLEAREVLDSTGNFIKSDLLKQVQCGNLEYFIGVTLTDRAGNESEQTFEKISSGDCPMCTTNGNSVFGLPYLNSSGKVSLQSSFLTRKIPGAYEASHAGLDFAAPFGTPILSSSEGVVRSVVMNYEDYGYYGHPAGWGNTVIIEHPGKIQTIYAHLQNRQVVFAGQKVKQGQTIGFMGSSGSSTGPHLHFQVEQEGAYLNPTLKGKYNRWPPVDPALFLGTLNSNLNVFQRQVFCDTSFSIGANEQYPWSHLSSGYDLDGDKKILIKVDRNGNQVDASLFPKPLISYVNAKNPDNIQIYGVGIFKHMTLGVEVKEEVCVREFIFCFEWGYRNKTPENQDQEAVEHAEIILTKESTGEVITQFWNDDPPFNQGKWKLENINMAEKNLKYGDKICATTKIYGKIGFKDYNYDGLSTERSECVELKNVKNLEEPVEVTGGRPTEGCKASMCFFNLEMVQGNKEKYDGGKVYIISHGRGDNIDGWVKIMGDAIASADSKNNVILVDWREIANDLSQPPEKASSWSVPIAEKIRMKLLEWGFTNRDDLHLIGHSLGTLQASQISEQFLGAKTLTLLSPPGNFYNPKDKDSQYVVDGRSMKRQSSFAGYAQFSRSFVVLGTVADNTGLAATADEAFTIDTNEVFDTNIVETAENRHNSSPKVYLELIKNRKLYNNLLDLNNYSSNNFKKSNKFGWVEDFNGKIMTRGNINLNYLEIMDSLGKKIYYGTNQNDAIGFSIGPKHDIFGHQGDDRFVLSSEKQEQNNTVKDFSDQDKIQLSLSYAGTTFSVRNENGIPVVYQKYGRYGSDYRVVSVEGGSSHLITNAEIGSKDSKIFIKK